ncbi:hypothetical protein BDV18DRAFT_141242 [Aspergillus unguis]
MPPGLGKSIGDPDSDDYVAQVLAKEARDSSMKYSSLGMEAYMPARPSGSAPKPNTRFLRHIIKETDNHNAALKRKEEREARERARQLREQGSSTRDNTKDRHHHRSHRSDDRDACRRRADREDRHRSHRSRRSRSRSPDTDRPRASRRGRETRDRETRDRDDDRHRHSRRSRRNRSYSRSRSRSPRGREDSDRHRRRHRRRSTSRSRSPLKSRKDKDSRRSETEYSIPTSKDKTSGNDSDPLEDLVGPLPQKEAPIRSRGRGAYTNNSNIDAHFAPDYDPTLDVQADDDEVQTGNKPTRRPVAGLMTGDDDWELALEALRDRARWKQTGENRLREAGFNSDIVERWKNSPTTTGGDNGLLESVKWSTKGEGREWDRGKFVDDDGHINVKANW